MDESTEVVATPPQRVTVEELWNKLQYYGFGLPVTISWSGIVIDHRDVIPVPHEHLCDKEE